MYSADYQVPMYCGCEIFSLKFGPWIDAIFRTLIFKFILALLFRAVIRGRVIRFPRFISINFEDSSFTLFYL